MRRHADGFDPQHLGGLATVLGPGELDAMHASAQAVRLDDAVGRYIVDLVRRTRTDPSLELGASPRASIAMLRAAQVIAASEARDFVTPDDVKAMAKPILRHRVMLHPDAELSGVSVEDRIDEILRAAPVPRAAA